MEQEKPTTITVSTETSYWEQVLNRVYSADEKGTNLSKKSTIEARKRVIVLGDRGSGKSSLFKRSIAAAAEQAIPKGFGNASAPISSEKGCGFSYNLGYFGGFRGDEELDNFFGENDYDVIGDDDDDTAFAGIFEIGSLDQAHTLLSHAIPSEAAYKDSVFVIVVNPVNSRKNCAPAMTSLKKWIDVIRSFATEKGYIKRNSGMDISIDDIRKNRAISTFSQFTRVQNFIFSSGKKVTAKTENDPENIENAPDVKMSQTTAEPTPEELASLAEVLCDNIGAPIVVSLSKVDSDAMLSQKGGLVVSSSAEQEATFEFLGVVRDYLRQRCLALGAALLFTSERKNRNVDVLYAYIGYLLFGMRVGYRVQAAGPADSVFIPAGWDSKSKIAFEFESKKISTGESFGSVISSRFNRVEEGSEGEREDGGDDVIDDVITSNGGSGNSWESDQEFLKLLKNRLESTPVCGGGDDVMASMEFAVPSTTSPVSSGLQPSVSPTLNTTLNFRSLRKKDNSGAAAAANNAAGTTTPSGSPQPSNITE